jgi:hypothetical protein
MNIPGGPESIENPDSDIELQYKRLRMLTQATAVAVLILTGTLFVFIYRQVVLVRRQTAELARYVSEVERSGMPDFYEQVRLKLNEFRKQHPDFNAIYVRYFGANEPVRPEKVTSTPAAGATNTPTTR